MYDINNIANIADKVAEAAAVKKGGYTYKRSISRQSNTIRRSKSKRTRRYTK
jgi:hypothetical protein